ncbi:RhoGAP domain-containing protein [Colletotrichum higginsianum]|uniref:RhoGAP domain-containing protein n=2 Tax=Colletotrichum higginsianum TaxID=80884 RepID=H1VU96_COLHI|nr:RhoGAP domain-containing protein [Colletotrichum higginsianum IMI 349063]OBR13527.1 RhoGAP domain-containing protein [Colletotrichum higginsianum IMI 349063]TID02149.1 Rho-GTPase-activating protein 5 [Colletotrichum higginsianum]CCF43805.1 RhoGAP domain-containing protein [Colletotrichum higginsianum]
MTSAVPPPNQALQPTSTSTAPAGPSTPNKRDLKSWWKGFKLPSKHQEQHGRTPSVLASHSSPPTQPLFSEDVDYAIDTSTMPLSLVLVLQDAYVVEPADPVLPRACASSDATPSTTLSLACVLNRLSLSIATPVRQCAKRIRATMTTTATTSGADHSPADNRPHGIFGVPLRQSITYANVAISLVDENGKSYIYGYVPIVVAKCGVFLKEKATAVEGIFRLSGSEKRIKELKQIFDSPDRYGKGLVWDNYTVHDAANVLRRYLNDLPEPVVPLDLYEKFREPLRGATRQAVGDAEGPQFVENFDEQAAIVKYQKLITELPPLNRQLLLYILDLLAVFAAKSEENRMNSQNLAAIFQPGMLSHPQHAMAPEEYRLNQCVLIFLIENQDHFLIGMQGTATDEKTKQLIEKGTPPAAGGPVTPNPNRKSGLGRSASNASAGAESVRREGMVRRNRSTSSRHSHQEGSTTPNSPALAPTPNSGLGRSNTVPSKKSPALQTGRFRRDASPIPGSSPREPMIPATTEEMVEIPDHSPTASTASHAPAVIGTSSLAPSAAGMAGRSQERLLDPNETTTPMKDRSLPTIFQRSPTGEGEKRQPNKLKKKRIPGSLNPSAQSSAASLAGTHSAAVSPSVEAPNPMDLVGGPIPEHDEAVPVGQQSNSVETPSEPTPRASQVPSSSTLHPEQTLKGKKSPPTSLHSSFNEGSDIDQTEESIMTASADANEPEKDKKKRWRLSRQRGHEHHPSITSPRLAFGSNDNADVSVTSIGSGGYKPRKSFTGESSETGFHAAEAQSSHESRDKDGKDESKGPIGWIKNKYREAKESAEQRRNKSPPADRQSSLGGSSIMSGRGKSLEIRREPDEKAQNDHAAPVPPFPSQPTQAQPAQTQPSVAPPAPPVPASTPAQQKSFPLAAPAPMVPAPTAAAEPAVTRPSPPQPAQPPPAASQLAAASQPELAPPQQSLSEETR